MKLTSLSRSIEGLTAVVTGAAGGMGESTAKLFADEGAKVALIDRDEDKLNRVVAEINEADHTAKGWALDLSDPAATVDVVEAIAEEFGGIDILVNNAGISLPTAIDGDGYDEAWATSIEILLTAHTRTIRAALPHLLRSTNPRIVNIASTEGLGATKGMSPYTSAKHGVIGLTRSLAVELGPRGVTVNCICPGPIRTAMTAEIPEEQKMQYARRRVALKRYGDPEEVAHSTLNFCLPSSSFVTGAVLPVDGGLTVKNA